jgi:hypothetical protein
VVVLGVYDAFVWADRVVGSFPKRSASVEVCAYCEPVVDAIEIFYIKVTSAAIVVFVGACYAIAPLCGRE